MKVFATPYEDEPFEEFAIACLTFRCLVCGKCLPMNHLSRDCDDEVCGDCVANGYWDTKHHMPIV